MSKLKNIFKQAQKNEKLQQQGKLTTNNFYVNTNGMSYKDFKKAMKQNGWSADSKEARGFFYEQLNPEPEETIQKVKNPYIVGLGETLLPIDPVTPTGIEKVVVKETSTKPVVKPTVNPVKTVVNPVKTVVKEVPVKAIQKVSQPEQQVTEVTKVIVPANSGSLDPTLFDWNKMNEEFGGLSSEQVQDFLKYQQFLKNHSHKHYMFPASWGAYNTHYFQKGGSVKQTNNQQDAVMQFVKALAQTLQADPQQVIQAAQQNPEALKSAVQVYQDSKGDIQKAAQAFSQELQSKAQAAKHGAKLNYLKSLKNQCAEDEELYYYKKGGSVGCGCKKKEQGRELKEKKESTVSKFKKACGGFKMKFQDGGKSLVKNDSISTNNAILKFKKTIVKKEDKLDPETTKVLPNGKYPSYWTADDKIKWERKFGPKDEGAHYAKEEKCGGKMKKHQQGGSLNGIPFYQKGTSGVFKINPNQKKTPTKGVTQIWESEYFLPEENDYYNYSTGYNDKTVINDMYTNPDIYSQNKDTWILQKDSIPMTRLISNKWDQAFNKMNSDTIYNINHKTYSNIHPDYNIMKTLFEKKLSKYRK